jgi:thioredoxin 1
MKQLHTETEFDEFLKNNPKCIVDFGAEWCGPCKRIAPFFSSLSEEHTDVAFAKVDVDELRSVASKYVQSGIPCFITFESEKQVGELIGASNDKLKELVETLVNKSV